ncbi:MAG: hypothetical protein HY394_04070 [Candidatus Diapherotrites archaeon]|nr:hypothetical protein [Candidatus Diapherotrites archaeon]
MASFMLLEILAHILSLDFGWISGFALNNLLWVFILLALAHFFWEKTPLLIGFGVVVVYVLGSVTFTDILGWALLTPAFLLISYISRIAISTFAAHDEALAPKLPLILVAQFFAALVIYNLFLR